jgi:heptosyltransferase-2
MATIRVQDILVFRNDRLGEFILTTPAIRALKKQFEGSVVHAVVNPALVELAGSFDCIDKVYAWENKKHSISEIVHFIRTLKQRKFQLCIVFNPVKESHLICRLSGIPIRVGYNRKWGFLLNRSMSDKKSLGQKHEIEYNLELLHCIGIDSRDTCLSFEMKDSGMRFTQREGAIAIHPWTSDSLKQWPIGNFVQLAKKLTEEAGHQVIVIGGQEHSGQSRSFFASLSDKIIDLTGKTSLIESAHILKRAKLLISGDSGPVHLASCLQVPVLAIFRNDLPGKTPLRWGPRSKHSVVIERNDLRAITVDEVFARVQEVLPP